jgi:ribosomal subunit interface protein
MIKLHISGHGFELDQKMIDYAQVKLGSLDKYLPKSAKNSTGRVILSFDPSGREDNCYLCETMLEVPGPNLESKEATLNAYAAIDIVAAKLRAQAKKYKDKNGGRRRRVAMRLVNRILRRSAADVTPEVAAE